MSIVTDTYFPTTYSTFKPSAYRNQQSKNDWSNYSTRFNSEAEFDDPNNCRIYLSKRQQKKALKKAQRCQRRLPRQPLKRKNGREERLSEQTTDFLTDDSGDDSSAKYKTELCKHFSETGTCKWADKCRFAHGTEEIHLKTHINLQYKTKLCENFFNKGFCPYGHRCQYQHDNSRVTVLENFAERLLAAVAKSTHLDLSKVISQQQSCFKRLPVFKVMNKKKSKIGEQSQPFQQTFTSSEAASSYLRHLPI